MHETRPFAHVVDHKLQSQCIRAHLSHIVGFSSITFCVHLLTTSSTHEALNNATYSDASKEISFNQAWLKQVGISAAQRFSAGGLVPPAITGLHNGDAIKAWRDNGIKNVVGDNTRPVLMNKDNSFWPLMSTVASNGYAGLLIMPR